MLTRNQSPPLSLKSQKKWFQGQPYQLIVSFNLAKGFARYTSTWIFLSHEYLGRISFWMYLKSYRHFCQAFLFANHFVTKTKTYNEISIQIRRSDWFTLFFFKRSLMILWQVLTTSVSWFPLIQVFNLFSKDTFFRDLHVAYSWQFDSR